MQTKVTITATFKHTKKVDFDAVKDGILIGMRDAFVDDLAVTGDIDVEPYKTPSYGGITRLDVVTSAKDKGVKLSEEEIQSVLDEYESNLLFDGSGMHGSDLIDWCMEELKLTK